MSDSPTPRSDGPAGGGSGDGYVATELGDHWIHRPDSPDPEPTVLDGPGTPTARLGHAPEAAPPGNPAHAEATVRAGDPALPEPTLVSGPAMSFPPAGPVPDRVEGEVLRFGPGVTGSALTRNRTTAADIWHGTLAGQPHGHGHEPSGKRRRVGPRRYTLAAVVFIAVIAFLLWQRLGPGIAVQSLTVRTPNTLSCDDTADVTGFVRTNGQPGTIEYRWLRSDGTTSGTLREQLTKGQREARLHLLWTFRGRGTHQASAELRITSPGTHTAATRFTYDCP